MNALRRAPGALEILALALPLAAALSGCDPFVDGDAHVFNSGQTESESMSGREWGSGAFLELTPLSPAHSSGITHRGYDVHVTDTEVELAAALYETTSTRFLGYYRKYTQGSGWAASGLEFLPVATTLGADIGYVGFGGNGAGLRLMSFFEDGNPNAIVLSSHDSFADNTVLSADGVTAGPGSSGSPTGVYPPYASFISSELYSRPLKIVYDSLGAAYVVTVASGSGELSVLRWESTPADFTSINDLGSSSVELTFDAAWDGKDRVCFSYEQGATPSLRARCLNVVNPASPPYELETAANYNAGLTRGHAMASDGNGNVLAVFYQRVSSTWGLYSALHTEAGGWGTAVQVDQGMPVPNYQTAPDACDPAAGNCGDLLPKPAIVHVGGGHFVAVWVSVNVADKSAGLFYATYFPLDGWGPVKLLGPLRSYSNVKLPFLSPSLHGTTSGDAVLGVRYLASEPSAADRRFDIYKTYAARYHREVGFKKTATLGDGCSPGLTSEFAACMHPARVAQLKSGDAVIIHTDQDQNLKYRLESVEFK